MAHDVFLSHSSKDKAVADAVCAILEGQGIRCWIAPRDILPSQTWAGAITQAILDCQVFVLIVSSSSNLSPDVLRELSNAASKGKPILPLRIEATELSSDMQYYLNNVHWLDALTEPRERQISALAEQVRRLLGRAPRQDPAYEATVPSVAVSPPRQEPPKPAPPPPEEPPVAPRQVVFPVPSDKPWDRPGSKVGDEIIGPDGGPMVWVPAGEFLMGSPDYEGSADEHPQHRVKITKGFWLGKHTVTNAQYRAYCETAGRTFPADSKNGPNHPVVYVTLGDAKEYCDRYGLTLPTEAQWEYAARGPQGLGHPWGNEWDAKKCCNLANKGWGDLGTIEVGSLPAGDSWCGASDLAGNVWEWCADQYDGGYYAQSPLEDPQGPADGAGRLLRGGSWGGTPGSCRSARRGYGDPGSGGRGDGFRVARTP